MAKGQILPRTHSRWLLRIYHGRHPISRARVYKNTPIAGSLDSAERELVRQLALRPSHPSPASSFSEYADYWLSMAVEPRLRERTAQDYREHLARYALQSIGEVRLQDLDPVAIQTAYSGLLERRLSARTIRYTHSIVHAALAQAKIWKLIPENPASGLPLPPAKRYEFTVFTPDQARRFITAASLDPNGLVLIVALATGLRPSEYLALRRRDFDRERSTFSVERTLERVPTRIDGGVSEPGRWKFEQTEPSRSYRTVLIAAELASRVANVVDQQMDLFDTKRIGTRTGVAELIFRTTRGKPIHERNLVQRVFKPLLRRAELPDLRLYDLRHSFATLALRAGTPPELVSEQLAHSSVAFTLDTYADVIEETRGEAAQDLSDFLIVRPSIGSQRMIDSERKPVASETAQPNEKLA